MSKCDRRTRRGRRGGRAGLSLVEVMLALSILVIGLGAWLTAAARGLAVISQSQRYTLSRHLLERVDVEYPLALEEELSTGMQQGDFAPEHPGYRWQREISEVEPAGRGLYQVRTRVTWAEHGRAAYDELLTYHYAPEEPYGGTFSRPRHD